MNQSLKSINPLFPPVSKLQKCLPKVGLGFDLVSFEKCRQQIYLPAFGRYVGVVIEEDGKTEAEFSAELAEMHEEFEKLNSESVELGFVIANNMAALSGSSL